MEASHQVSDAVVSLLTPSNPDVTRLRQRQSNMWKRRQGLQTWFLDFALPFGLGIKGRWESLVSCAPEPTLDRVETIAALHGGRGQKER